MAGLAGMVHLFSDELILALVLGRQVWRVSMARDPQTFNLCDIHEFISLMSILLKSHNVAAQFLYHA